MSKPLKNQVILSLSSLFCSIMGRQPGNGNSLFKRLFLVSFFPKFLFLFAKNMLNYKLRLLDVHDPKIREVLKDKSFKSRGILNIFGKIWSLKMNETELMKVLSLFDRFSDKDDDLILSLMDYFKTFGMNRALWRKLERSACPKRDISKRRLHGYKRTF